MKVVFDENVFDEIDHFHSNFDESVPNQATGYVLSNRSVLLILLSVCIITLNDYCIEILRIHQFERWPAPC